MKIVKAFIKRYFHLLIKQLKLEQVHCAYTEGKAVNFLGLMFFIKIKKVGCTCGKVFFKK